MTTGIDTIDEKGLRERQARRIRMARGAAGLSAQQLAKAVTEAGATLSRERVGKLEGGIGDMADPFLLQTIARVAWDQLGKEIANPIEWLNGSPPIIPGPTRVNPGYIKRLRSNPLDRPLAPVFAISPPPLPDERVA